MQPHSPYSYPDSNRIDPPPSRRSSPRRGRRRRRRRRNPYIPVFCAAAVLVGLIAAAGFLVVRAAGSRGEADSGDVSRPLPNQSVTAAISLPEPEPEPAYELFTTENTAQIADTFASQYVVLIDMETGEILAQRDSDARINPASMTKILTLLVAAETIQDWDATFTMTIAESDYCYQNECSVVGYMLDEVVPARELLYGCILCSGADASLGLAQLACGSHQAFVDKMNEKLDELGLSQTTHFTNCVGLYDQDHYTTVEDMALILKAAWENELCRQVLSTKIYTSQPTPQHPEGQVLSNWFIRRIEDLSNGAVTVLTGKTGYVTESGFCAASYGETADGRGVLCVTAKSTGTWRSIYDHSELFRTFFPVPEESEQSE